MENVSRTIKEKLQFLLTDDSKSLRKVFNLSLERLQDNPRAVFVEIENYIKEHKDKIDDFRFEAYIDEVTFKPVLVMHIVPILPIREGMLNSFWGNLANMDIRPFSISEKIETIFQSFAFEFNTPEVRTQLCWMVENVLKMHTAVDFKVVDLTVLNENTTVGIDYNGSITTIKEFLIFLCDNNLISKYE